VVRSLALASLEDVVLWDERDLTNSSAERVIMPEMFGLVSEQLTTMTEVVRNLVLDEEAIERNLNSTKGVIFSEFILGELVLSGMGRAEAHRLVSGIVEEVASSKKDFLTLLRDDRVVSSKISDEKLRILFDPKKALLLSDELIDKAIAEAGQIPHD
jgi:adenylosuccinate lyase